MTMATVDSYLREQGWIVRKHVAEKRSGDALGAFIFMEINSSIDFLINEYDVYFKSEEDFMQFVLELPSNFNDLRFY